MLQTQLKQHQKKAVRWMIQREEKYDGGFLFLEMGLGKTICTLTTILKDLQDDIEHKTLVICNASLINNWIREIYDHTTMDEKNILVYRDGDRNDKIKKKQKIVIASYNVVTLEYDKVQDEFKEGSIFKKHFHRIVLDEAHQIRTTKTKGFQSVNRLIGDKRWVLTATPIVNTPEDLYAYFMFCRLIGDRKDWTSIVGRGKKKSYETINDMVDRNALKWKKDEVLGDELEELTERVVKLKMKDKEWEFYERLMKYNFERMKKLKDQLDMWKESETEIDRQIKQKMTSHILTLILRLRQACNSAEMILDTPELRNKSFDEALKFFKDNKDKNILNQSDDDDEEDQEEESKHTNLLDEDDTKVVKQPLIQKPNPVIAELDYTPVKTKAVLKILKVAFQNDEKVIVVSQWTKTIDMFKRKIEQVYPHIETVEMSGRINLKDRDANIMKFQTQKNTKVCFISLTASAEGINLTSANHVVLVDLWWNNAKMEQVAARAHRIGQTKEVKVYKLISAGTIEEKMMQLVDKKQKESDMVMKKWNPKSADDGLINDVIKLLEPIARNNNSDNDDEIDEVQ